MTNRNPETPIVDPDEQFADPVEVLAREDMSRAEKLKLLESWQSDLVLLLKAVDENMASAGSEPGETAGRLARVTKAIAKLKDRGR